MQAPGLLIRIRTINQYICDFQEEIMRKAKNTKKERKTFTRKIPIILTSVIVIIFILSYSFSRTNKGEHGSLASYTEEGNYYASEQAMNNSANISTSKTATAPAQKTDTMVNNNSPTGVAATQETNDDFLPESSNIENNESVDRKITKSANLYIQTNEFDQSINQITSFAKENGGYFASSYLSNTSYSSSTRSADYTAMIPADKYDNFIASLSDVGDITEKSEQSDDLTAVYVDVEARLTSLRTQETRLQILMENAEKMEDILVIQEQLTKVQYEIESYVSTQRTYDGMVEYSTITITLSERSNRTPVEPTKYTFWDQVKDAVSDSLDNSLVFLQDLFIGFIYAIPLIVLLAIVVALCILIKKLAQKKMAKKTFNQNLKSTISTEIPDIKPLPSKENSPGAETPEQNE